MPDTEELDLVQLAANAHKQLRPLLLNDIKDEKSMMDMESREKFELEQKKELVIRSILQIKQSGNFGVDSCMSLLPIWRNWTESDMTASGANVSPLLLIEVTAKCVFGGGWMVVLESVKSELTNFILREGNHNDCDDRNKRFRNMCQGMAHIIQYNVWSAPYLEKIYNSTELAVEMEAVNEMWTVEDCEFIKIRVEWLCVANDLQKAKALVQGSILKFRSIYGDNPKIEDVGAAMSSDDFLEFGTIFVLLSVKLNQDLTSVCNLFSLATRDYIFDKLVADVDSNRIATKWKKGWKYKDDIAQGWVEKLLWESVTAPIPVPTAAIIEVVFRSIFSTAAKWLKLTYKLNQQKYLAGANFASKAHMYNLTPEAQENLKEEEKKFLSILPVEVIDDLCKNVRDQGYLSCFAAALNMEFGLEWLGIRSKCVKLCVDALSNQSNELEQLRMSGLGDPSKGEIAAKERALAMEYKELALSFKNDPAMAFDVVLTAFSLNPTEELFKKLKELAQERSGRSPTGNMQTSENDENAWTKTVWECVSCSKKSSELGIPETTLQTLICVSANSRLSNFNTVRPSWSFYEPLCSKHLKTRGSEILDLNNLEFARPDYSKFSYLKEDYGDEMIFEAGFEPTADDSDDKAKGKPVKKEPQSRFKEWKRFLRTRDSGVKTKDEPALKKSKPSVEKRKYVRVRNVRKVVKKRISVLRKREDERTKPPATEENFTEAFPLCTLQSLRIDIYALRDVQEGQRIVFSTSELIRKLSLDDNPVPSKVDPQSESESTSSRKSQQRSRQPAAPERRPSINSQRKADQLQCSLNSMHTYSPTALDYSEVGRKNAITKSGKTNVIGNVPLFTHLMSSLQRIRVPDPKGTKDFTTDHATNKSISTQSDSFRESKSSQKRTRQLKEQKATTKKKVHQAKSLPLFAANAMDESRRKYDPTVLHEDEESKEDECDQITKLIEESGFNKVKETYSVKPSGEYNVRGDDQDDNLGDGSTANSIELGLPTFLEPEVEAEEAEVEDIENYLRSSLRKMEFKPGEQGLGFSKLIGDLSDPDGSRNAKDDKAESTEIENAAVVALIKLRGSRLADVEDFQLRKEKEANVVAEPKEPCDSQSVWFVGQEDSVKPEEDPEGDNSTVNSSITITADEDEVTQAVEDHLVLHSESPSEDQPLVASESNCLHHSQETTSVYSVVPVNNEDNEMNSNIDVNPLELSNTNKPHLAVEIDLTSDFEMNTSWKKKTVSRRTPLEEIKCVPLPLSIELSKPETHFGSSSHALQPMFPAPDVNTNIVFHEEEVRIAVSEVETAELSRNDAIPKNDEERFLLLPWSEAAGQPQSKSCTSHGMDISNLECFVNVPRLNVSIIELKSLEVGQGSPQTHSILNATHPSPPESVRAPGINDITKLQALINSCDQRREELVDNLKSDGNGNCSLSSSPTEKECPVLEPTTDFSRGEFSSPSGTDDEVSPPALDCYLQPTHV